MLPSSPDSSSCVSADLLRASYLMGDAMAGAAIRLARSEQIQDQISIAALMEISATEWLGSWIKHDLCGPANEQIDSVMESLPSRVDLLSDEQLLAEPSRLPPLTELVLAIWEKHFAWSGPEEIGADVALESAGEDETLEALADFLWEHRHAGISSEKTT